MKHSIIILTIALLISSCHQKQHDNNTLMLADAVMDEETIPVTKQQENSTNALPPLALKETTKTKIIKDGRIGIEVQDLEQTKSNIDSLIIKYGGYYANERLNNYEREISYSLKIRVPGNNFERLIADVETGKGEIKYKEIDARDVTDQFVDLEIRLANKKSYLNKYIDLLKQAKSVKDILEIEEKIRAIEEEIESTTGRLKYLTDLVEFSTLDLMISKTKDYKYQPVKRDNFVKRIKHALLKGWFGFVDFVVFLIKIWPFWIIIGLVYFGWKNYSKRRKNKK